MEKRYINLEKENYENTAYRLKGSDPLLKRVHSHEGFEIIQTWSNDGYVLIQGRVYPLREGSIYLINGIKPHSTNPTNEENYCRSKIVFSPSHIQPFIEIMNLPNIYDPFISTGADTVNMLTPILEDRTELDNIFKKISIELKKKKWGSEAVVTSNILEMLVSIYRIYSLDQEIQPVNQINCYQGHISQVINYVNENLKKKISLDDMCNELYISKYYICHLFKKITGMTIMQYAANNRIYEAKKLLIMTEHPISDIAMMTGFGSFSLFSRTFGKLAGCTPFDYRKKHASNSISKLIL